MAAKKKTRTSSEKKMTKSGFIRSLPDRTPAKEVIAKAKELGLDLNEKFVWTVQSEMRSGGKGAGKKGTASRIKTESTSAMPSATALAAAAPAVVKPGKKKPGPKVGFRKKATGKATVKTLSVPVTARNGSTAEQKLKALVIELGTARADEVYRAVKSQLSAIVGGA